LANLFEKINAARLGKIGQRHFILFASLVIGFVAGLVAVILKNGVFLIRNLLTEDISMEKLPFLYIVYPLVGLIVTVWLVKKVFKKSPGMGIPSTLYAISRRKSILKRHQMYTSLISSIVTVGFGGSVGLESPAVQTSAAVGSNLGKAFKLDYRTKTLLIGCAAAGALSSIFYTPVAAILFAVEVIMLDLTTASLVPLLLASISALFTANFFIGEEDILRIQMTEAFEMAHLHYYAIFGVITGLCSSYFSRFYMLIRKWMLSIKFPFQRVVVGGLILGTILFFFPALYGEGYDVINEMLQGDIGDEVRKSRLFDFGRGPGGILLFLLCLLLFKVIATAVTVGAGGVGGVFAPTLYMGSILGFLYAKSMAFFNLKELPVSNFALVGMAGLMAGVLHAPLTAIFMIAEITSGYELFVPLMITAAISYYTTKVFSPHTIYTKALAERGELITHDKDQAVLTLMNLKHVIENNFVAISPTDNLGSLVNSIGASKRNIFPVLGPSKELVGIVTLDDVREIMFDRSQYEELTVQALMTTPPEIIFASDSMETVMQKFESSEAWNLPVVDNQRYVGFVSKSRMFSAYREKLVEFSDRK
jgi:CIC family chloride channel protein